jgi:hypothetical protein
MRTPERGAVAPTGAQPSAAAAEGQNPEREHGAEHSADDPDPDQRQDTCPKTNETVTVRTDQLSCSPARAVEIAEATRVRCVQFLIRRIYE